MPERPLDDRSARVAMMIPRLQRIGGLTKASHTSQSAMGDTSGLRYILKMGLLSDTGTAFRGLSRETYWSTIATQRFVR